MIFKFRMRTKQMRLWPIRSSSIYRKNARNSNWIISEIFRHKHFINCIRYAIFFFHLSHCFLLNTFNNICLIQNMDKTLFFSNHANRVNPFLRWRIWTTASRLFVASTLILLRGKLWTHSSTYLESLTEMEDLFLAGTSRFRLPCAFLKCIVHLKGIHMLHRHYWRLLCLCLRWSGGDFLYGRGR